MSPGISYTIPLNVAQKVIPDLIAGKKVEQPWFGISSMASNETPAKELGLSVDLGDYVITVSSGSALLFLTNKGHQKVANSSR